MKLTESQLRSIVREELNKTLNEGVFGDIAQGISRTFRSGGLPGSDVNVKQKLEDYKNAIIEDDIGNGLWNYGLRPLLVENGTEFLHYIVKEINNIKTGKVNRVMRIPKKFVGAQMPRQEFKFPDEINGEKVNFDLFADALLDVLSTHGVKSANVPKYIRKINK